MFPLLLATAVVSGCSGDLSTLSPAGPVAGSIARLWWVMAGGAGLLFVLVMGLLLLTMLRPGFGRTLSPRGWIVLGGIVLPIPVLVPLLAYSFAQGERLLLAGGASDKMVRIEARARMWQWEFIYLDQPGMAATEGVLHIPSGTPIEITATSADVIHSFWVPRLGGKVDAVPGHAGRVRILADAPGIYRGVCAEFCGPGHSVMLFNVHAHEASDYERVIGEARTAILQDAAARDRP